MGMSSQKNSYGKKILKKLGENPAVILNPLAFGTPPSQGERENKYAVMRAIKNLVGAGYAEMLDSGRENYVRLAKKGKTKLDTIRLLGEDALVPQTWDGFWRIIILDLPEERKSEREALRYLLKRANFVCIKNTVWISPHPYENLFMNIKKDLGFTAELMILVTDKLDEETKKAFLEAVR